MVAGPHPLVAPHVLHAAHGTQDGLLHDLAQYPGHADRSIVPCLLLPAFLTAGCHTVACSQLEPLQLARTDDTGWEVVQ